MDKSKEIKGMLCSIIASIAFGFSFFFTKGAVNNYSALTLLSWRFIFALAAMLICIALKVIKIDLRKKSLVPLIVIAVFQPVLYFIGETVGINLTTASESGVIISCIPITTILLNSLINKEKPTKLQVVAIFVSIIGMIVMVLVKGLEASFNPLGYLMLMVAVLADGLYISFARRAKDYTPSEKTFVMAVMGVIVFTGGALIEHGMHGTLGAYILAPFRDASFLISVVYLGAACQVLAFLRSNYSLITIGAARCASFAGLTTVVSVIAGVLLLGETFTLTQAAGALLVLAGVYATNIVPKNAVIVSPDKAESEAHDENA